MREVEGWIIRSTAWATQKHTCGIHWSMPDVSRSFSMSLAPLPVSGFRREHSTLSRNEITFSSFASCETK